MENKPQIIRPDLWKETKTREGASDSDNSQAPEKISCRNQEAKRSFGKCASSEECRVTGLFKTDSEKHSLDRDGKMIE